MDISALLCILMACEKASAAYFLGYPVTHLCITKVLYTMKLPNFKGKFQGTLQTLAGHGTFKLYHGWLWYIYMHHSGSSTANFIILFVM